MKTKRLLIFVLLTIVLISAAYGSKDLASEKIDASGESSSVQLHENASEVSHTDPVTPVLLWLVIILILSKLGGEFFEKIKQPPVLGELIAGILIGNVYYFTGLNFFQPLITNEYIDMLSRIGVVVLLFDVGLESNLEEMLKVGWASFWVAAVGVIAPFALGYFISTIVYPAEGSNLHIFVGATLCATSVGITARVFKDLGRISSKEAKIVLGAAVIDDVMGLVILSIVSAIIITGNISISSILFITFKTVIFLTIGIVAGVKAAPVITKYVAKLKVDGTKLVFALSTAFFLSYLASVIGLAPIVGAFAAGLILDEVHFSGFKSKEKLADMIKPISGFLVPLFFVFMGIQVKLETFTDTKVLGIAVGITVVAIIGKQVCGLVAGKGVNRWCVGFSMIPRGEVGLIFASIGKQLGVINDSIFSAIVIMVVVTTLVTPPLIKFSFKK